MPLPRHPSDSRLFFTARAVSMVFLAALILALSPTHLPAQDSHLIWRVCCGEASVTLMGSIHTLRPEDYPLPAAYEKAYDQADAVAFETDLARMNEPDVQAGLLALGLYPEGESLWDNLSPETASALSSAMRERGLSPAQFERFKPWLCALTLTMLELQRLGFSALHGLDMHFFARAVQDGKETLHLEPVEAHIDHLASFGRGNQEEILLQSLQDLEVLAYKSSRLADAWRSGDEEDLHDAIQMGFDGFPAIYDRLITQRNRDWLPHIEGLIKGDGNVLVIVGSAHLTGPESLVRMLEDRGYQLEREPQAR